MKMDLKLINLELMVLSVGDLVKQHANATSSIDLSAATSDSGIIV